MSTTLWSLRSQVKREEQVKHLPPSRISMRSALGLAEQVAREEVDLVEDRMRVREGRRLLVVALCCMVAGCAAGIMIARRLLECVV